MGWPVVALDAGGSSLRASVGSCDAPLELANHVAFATSAPNTTLLGRELLARERRDGSAKLRYVRPVERSSVTLASADSVCVCAYVRAAADAQMLAVNPREHALVATAPMFAPTVLNETMDQVMFEELGFQAFARVTAPEMCVLSYAAFCRQQRALSPVTKKRRRADAVAAADPLAFASSSCQLVVDSGYSFTHVVPVVDGRVLARGVKRVNVGGKLLTNYLKEIVSFRQFNVLDDARVVNAAKETLCYCALDFAAELPALHRGPRRDRARWVLPDYVHSFDGRLQEASDRDDDTTGGNDDEQALELGGERIAVPEVLFHPSDIGLDQAGVAEAIHQAVAACPAALHGALYANVLLVGGNTKLPHFRARLERDLRPLVPDELELALHAPPEYVSVLGGWWMDGG
ncbi:hypothetical protein PybrP1_006611 [[Pythium] brassicae (nom. inval.)]|nr:hypothetical protein PybrP1_006611 [[Pythium] brassicae (nom. inval.)]